MAAVLREVRCGYFFRRQVDCASAVQAPEIHIPYAEIHKGHELINVGHELINKGHEFFDKGHAAQPVRAWRFTLLFLHT